VKIEGKAKGKIEVKRFYTPGITISDTCPKCGKEVTHGGEEYFSYPTLGAKEMVYFYCGDCDEEWQDHVIIDLIVKAAR